jgi:hypothetical protein
MLGLWHWVYQMRCFSKQKIGVATIFHEKFHINQLGVHQPEGNRHHMAIMQLDHFDVMVMTHDDPQ